MYQTEGWGRVLKAGVGQRLRAPGVSRTVLLLGLTSLITDVSSEMVATVLPVYVVLYLQLTPFVFGVIDGLQQGAAALVRVAGGFAADRWRRYKEVAAAGYALSAACRLGLLAAGRAWPALAGVILLDRVGKGIRTAPRDALIALSSPRAGLATAFGVHRALDTAGAMLGPVAAFLILSAAPGAFDALFVSSFCIALVGLGVIVLFVENPPGLGAAARAAAGGAAAAAISLRAALGLVGGPRFRALVLAGAALSLATVSDGFVYLALQRRLHFDAGLLPLLYVATALVFFVLAVPAGQLADRVGRARVLVGGYALLAAAYAALLLPAPWAHWGPAAPAAAAVALVGGLVLLLGAYYAATDGVLAALASAVLPTELRASGLGLLTTATNVARLLASVLFGALWTRWSLDIAVGCFAAGLGAALLVAVLALPRAEHGATGELKEAVRG